jgi:SRSO17 transposase
VQWVADEALFGFSTGIVGSVADPILNASGSPVAAAARAAHDALVARFPSQSATLLRKQTPCPDNVRQTHQSLHHVVAHAPWSDEDILETVRQYALPAMQKQGPIQAGIVDDTGFVKKGT